MNISDLELVENLSETTAIEGGSYYGFGHYQNDFIKGYINYASFTVGVAVGNVAVASADAKAFGKDTYSKGATYTVTDPWYSNSSAYSVSVTGY
jgi:hypothetical protein